MRMSNKAMQTDGRFAAAADRPVVNRRNKMKKSVIAAFAVIAVGAIALAQAQKPLLTFDQLFPKAKQRQMGLYKLTAQERKLYALM